MMTAVQRRWNLVRVLRGLRDAQESLERLGDREADVAVLASLRRSIERDIEHFAAPSTGDRQATGFDTIDERDGGRLDR